MEWQRQRALVRRVCAGERPLVAIRRESVQRVRADLRLDPLLAERAQRVVAPVELDDVRLPPVHVAFVRGGRRYDPLQALGVGGRDARARGEQLVEAPDLRDPDRAEDVGEAAVRAGTGDL